ncbi:unnamed protein product, partial [Phaeothamnion confervicola]
MAIMGTATGRSAIHLAPLRPTMIRTNSMSTGSDARTDAKAGSAAELLTAYLNHILSSLCTVIRKHGGDILKFAGDAIIVCWPRRVCEPHTAQEGQAAMSLACCRAVKCAVDALKNYEEKLLQSGDRVMSMLGLHVGIGASRILAAHVGGVEGQWQFFVAGDAVGQMSSAEDEAKSGQVVVSGTVAEHLRSCHHDTSPAVAATVTAAEDGCESAVSSPGGGGGGGGGASGEGGEGGDCDGFGGGGGSGIDGSSGAGWIKELRCSKLESGNERIDALRCSRLPRASLANSQAWPSGMANVLKSYVPQPVRQALLDGTFLDEESTVGELRKMTVVFVKLLDINVDVDDDQRAVFMIDAALRKIQTAVVRFSATLQQFIFDDKGIIAVAVVGLPPCFHENNAVTAVKMAFWILHSGVSAQIGVTTGTAFAGIIGSDRRAEHTVIGDIVNMSARLMMKAKRNSILCDQRTAREAQDFLVFAESMNVQVKGKKEPVAVFQPIDPSLDTVCPTHLLVRPEHVRAIEALTSGGASATARTGSAGGSRNSGAGSGSASGGGGGSDGEAGEVRALLVEGTRGSGKSALLSHAMAAAGARGMLCLVSEGDEQDHHTSLHAFRPILQQVLSADKQRNGKDVGVAPPPTEREELVASITGRMVESSGDQRPTRSPLYVAAAAATEGVPDGLPLLNMVLPISREAPPPVGSTQELHERLARLADVLAFLIERRLWLRSPGAQAGSAGSAGGGGCAGVGGGVFRQASGAMLGPPVFQPSDDALLPVLASAVGEAPEKEKEPRGGARNQRTMMRRSSAYQSTTVLVEPQRPPQRSGGESRGAGVCLFFDNAHWLDHHSWEVLALLRRLLPGLAFMISYRPIPDHKAAILQTLKSAPAARALYLNRLSSAQVVMLLANRFGIDDADIKLLEHLETVAKGNPRDIIYALNCLLQDGILQIEPGKGRATLVKGLKELAGGAPMRDHDSAPIIARFDKLSRATQRSLQAASVVGESMPIDLLRFLMRKQLASSSMHAIAGAGGPGFGAAAVGDGNHFISARISLGQSGTLAAGAASSRSLQQAGSLSSCGGRRTSCEARGSSDGDGGGGDGRGGGDGAGAKGNGARSGVLAPGAAPPQVERRRTYKKSANSMVSDGSRASGLSSVGTNGGLARLPPGRIRLCLLKIRHRARRRHWRGGGGAGGRLTRQQTIRHSNGAGMSRREVLSSMSRRDLLSKFDPSTRGDPASLSLSSGGRGPPAAQAQLTPEAVVERIVELAMQTMFEAKWLVLDGADRMSGQVRFMDAGVVPVLRNMLLPSHREATHLAVVHWHLQDIKRAEPSPSPAFWHQLGTHALGGGDLPLALDLFVLSAEKAIAAGNAEGAEIACAAVSRVLDEQSNIVTASPAPSPASGGGRTPASGGSGGGRGGDGGGRGGHGRGGAHGGG